MKFIIFSDDYDDNNGGSIVLHYLCHLLNEMGFDSRITPFFKTYESHQYEFFKPLMRSISSRFRGLRKNFRTSDNLNTPIEYRHKNPLPDDVVVIYPEGVVGNPLGGKNVVRWLLHRPGFHTGKICYGVNELYFDYNAFSGDFSIPGSKISNKKLFIAKYHDNFYNMKDVLPLNQRSGTAHCIRKGNGKKAIHDHNSILIDGLSHEEISNIFKRVKTFISYDSKTMYSLMAVACGADSIVVPDAGVSKEQWEPNPVRSYGIAYGLDDLENARTTTSQALAQLDDLAVVSRSSVSEFVQEVRLHFQL